MVRYCYYVHTRTPFCYRFSILRLLRNATLNYATLRHNSPSPTGPDRKGRCTSNYPSHHFSIIGYSFDHYCLSAPSLRCASTAETTKRVGLRSMVQVEYHRRNSSLIHHIAGHGREQVTSICGIAFPLSKHPWWIRGLLSQQKVFVGLDQV